MLQYWDGNDFNARRLCAAVNLPAVLMLPIADTTNGHMNEEQNPYEAPREQSSTFRWNRTAKYFFIVVWLLLNALAVVVVVANFVREL